MSVRILDWDSKFFGFVVASIDDPYLDDRGLEDALDHSRSRGARLVYWSANAQRDGTMIDRLGGTLADRKTTYAVDLRANAKVFEPPRISAKARVGPADPSKDRAALESLAVQSGASSRFAVDPKFPHGLFVALYERWIRKALEKDMADEVLVIREGSELAGMVTLGDHEGRGDIGLIAVDARYRGNHYGEALVRASQRWFVQHEYTHGRVVTQGTNAAACRLYEKCGYAVESERFFYHFWF